MCIAIAHFLRHCRTFTFPNVNGKPALAFNLQVLLVFTSDFVSADYRKDPLVQRMLVNILFFSNGQGALSRVKQHWSKEFAFRTLSGTPECFASRRISRAWEAIWNPSALEREGTRVYTRVYFFKGPYILQLQ